MAVRGDDVEHRLGTPLHPGEILDAHGASPGSGDHEVLDVADAVDPAVHDGQVERVVLLVHPRRGHEVVAVEGIGDVGEAQVRVLQQERIDDHLVLRSLAAHQVHPSHPGDL